MQLAFFSCPVIPMFTVNCSVRSNVTYLTLGINNTYVIKTINRILYELGVGVGSSHRNIVHTHQLTHIQRKMQKKNLKTDSITSSRLTSPLSLSHFRQKIRVRKEEYTFRIKRTYMRDIWRPYFWPQRYLGDDIYYKVSQI